MGWHCRSMVFAARSEITDLAAHDNDESGLKGMNRTFASLPSKAATFTPRRDRPGRFRVRGRTRPCAFAM